MRNIGPARFTLHPGHGFHGDGSAALESTLNSSTAAGGGIAGLSPVSSSTEFSSAASALRYGRRRLAGRLGGLGYRAEFVIVAIGFQQAREFKVFGWEGQVQLSQQLLVAGHRFQHQLAFDVIDHDRISLEHDGPTIPRLFIEITGAF